MAATYGSLTGICTFGTFHELGLSPLSPHVLLLPCRQFANTDR